MSNWDKMEGMLDRAESAPPPKSKRIWGLWIPLLLLCGMVLGGVATYWWINHDTYSAHTALTTEFAETHINNEEDCESTFAPANLISPTTSNLPESSDTQIASNIDLSQAGPFAQTSQQTHARIPQETGHSASLVISEQEARQDIHPASALLDTVTSNHLSLEQAATAINVMVDSIPPTLADLTFEWPKAEAGMLPVSSDKFGEWGIRLHMNSPEYLLWSDQVKTLNQNQLTPGLSVFVQLGKRWELSGTAHVIAGADEFPRNVSFDFVNEQVVSDPASSPANNLTYVSISQMRGWGLALSGRMYTAKRLAGRLRGFGELGIGFDRITISRSWVPITQLDDVPDARNPLLSFEPQNGDFGLAPVYLEFNSGGNVGSSGDTRAWVGMVAGTLGLQYQLSPRMHIEMTGSWKFRQIWDTFPEVGENLNSDYLDVDLSQASAQRLSLGASLGIGYRFSK
ncbi:hypothetical protein [Pontibacter sp. G13]|uniref:hypothetical protein n=1 Tax=Pontibacter sp. G13 TaxID=3074898 RepID=UPI00288BF994|nr:hypothetical protein [Pontibacter sp. G13]WNJ16885.1 hypothetical protein RJD25_18630 [Pontibacter sp. G13]